MTVNTATGQPSQRIHLPGTYNLRAVDSAAVSSAIVTDGRLYRSDALHAIDETGNKALRDLGIRRVIDLRSDNEVLRRPNRIDSDIEYIRVPLTLVEPDQVPEASLDLTAMYARLVRNNGSLLTQAVAALAVPDHGAVLVHCTAGKDRTGLVVALALLVIGIEETNVVDDYARTEAHLTGEWTDGMLSDLYLHGYPVTEQMIKILNGSPAETMVATIELLNHEFGGAKRYLTDHGMTISQLQALERFLVDATQETRLKKGTTGE